MAGRVRGLLERILARRRETAGEGVADSELLRRFTHDRDEAAFELLVWRHGAMVLGLCQRTIRDVQLAEDAFQAVFLILARKANSVRGNLGGWLFKVARRVAARALRKRMTVQPVIERAESSTDSTERDELFALLDAEIARLPERLRRPIVLCYLGGYSTENAARELGCPRGTVLSRLATARKRLAERLTRRGVVLPASLVIASVSGQFVSSVTAAAKSYRTGSLTQSTVTQLADGVLQTMRRATFFTAIGGLVLATTLAAGIGWGAGQHGPNSSGDGKDHTPIATVPTAGPPAKLPAASRPKPDAPQAAVEEKIKKLEQYAEKLKLEIETMERQIELLTKVSGAMSKDDERLKRLQKQLDELEEEYRRASRELRKLEIEYAVLKKQLEDKDDAIPIDPSVIQLMVDAHPLVAAAGAKVLSLRTALEEAQLRGSAELVKKLKRELAEVEKAHEAAVKHATAEALNAAKAATKRHLEKLSNDILVLKNVCEDLKAECDALRKLVASGTGNGIDIAALRKSVEPQREILSRVQRELLLARLERDGVKLSEPSKADAKLDEILRELAELRKDVQELKGQKK